MVCRVLQSRYEDPTVLQCHHQWGEFALCTVCPRVELLAKHNAARAHPYEPEQGWVVANEVYGKDHKSRGSSQRV